MTASSRSQPQLGHVADVRVQLVGSPPHQLAQPRHRRVAGRDLLLGQPRGRLVQVERHVARDLDAALDRARVPREPVQHLGAGPQVRRAGRGQPAVELGQAAPGPDGRDGLGEPAIGRACEVDVVGGHRGQAMIGGQLGERVVDRTVSGMPVVGQLDGHGVVAEQCGEAVQRTRCRFLATVGQRLANQTLATAGEDVPVAAPLLGQLLEVVERSTFLVAAQLRLGDRPGQPVVSLDAAGEHEQVAALGVGDPLLRGRETERQLRPVHRAQRRVLLGRLREPHRAVEAVVVGDGQRGQAEPHRLLDERLGVAGTVEEAVAAVAVQLGVRHHRTRRWLGTPVGLVPLPLAAERRPVATVGPAGAQLARTLLVGRLSAAAGQPALQLTPRDVGVLPAHHGLPSVIASLGEPVAVLDHHQPGAAVDAHDLEPGDASGRGLVPPQLVDRPRTGPRRHRLPRC